MPSRAVIAITDYLSEAEVELPLLEGLGELRLLQAQSESEVLDAAPEAEALMVYHEIALSDNALSQLSRCRVIVRCGVGFDNIDLESAGRHGIVVCNVPDYGTEEVADHALMLLLAVVRRLIPSHQNIVAGGWQAPLIFGAPRLRGRTLGLLGCGRIGSAMALRAKALGLRVVIYDPYQPHGLEKALGVDRAHSLEELLRQSELLSLHCPLTPRTHHVLNAETLSLLPQGAYVINTARGGCIDLHALLAALDSGQVRAAGLDVTDGEPLAHEGIRAHPNVVLTPHVAYYSVEGLREMRQKGAAEVRRALTGEAVFNPVNGPFLKNPRCLVSEVSPASGGR